MQKHQRSNPRQEYDMNGEWLRTDDGYFNCKWMETRSIKEKRLCSVAAKWKFVYQEGGSVRQLSSSMRKKRYRARKMVNIFSGYSINSEPRQTSSVICHFLWVDSRLPLVEGTFLVIHHHCYVVEGWTVGSVCYLPFAQMILFANSKYQETGK